MRQLGGEQVVGEPSAGRAARVVGRQPLVQEGVQRRLDRLPPLARQYPERRLAMSKDMIDHEADCGLASIRPRRLGQGSQHDPNGGTEEFVLVAEVLIEGRATDASAADNFGDPELFVGSLEDEAIEGRQKRRPGSLRAGILALGCIAGHAGHRTDCVRDPEHPIARAFARSDLCRTMTATTPNDSTGPTTTAQEAGDSSASRHAPTTGAILIATSALAVLFMLMHPTSHAHSTSEFLAEAARGIPGNGAVHGILVSLVAITASAFLGFADVIGPRHPAARLGVFLYLVGAIAGIGAGLINGFIVPAFAAATTAAHATLNAADPSGLELQLGAVLRLCGVTNATLATVDVIGLSVAAILWGTTLVTRRGTLWGLERLVGLVGLVAGALPLVLLVLGRLPMNVQGFGLFVVIQGFWGSCAGALLMRR